MDSAGLKILIVRFCKVVIVILKFDEVGGAAGASSFIVQIPSILFVHLIVPW